MFQALFPPAFSPAYSVLERDLQIVAKIQYKLFLFAIIFSPLAFGAVEPWSLFIMEVSTFIAICIMLIEHLREKEALMYEVPGLVPLMLLLAYICFQLVPLPPEIVRVFSPGSYIFYRDTVWVAEPGQWVSLAINRKAALSEFFRFASYAGIYILTVQLLAQGKVLKRTVTVIIAFGAVLAFFAIIQHLLPNNRIYWVRELTRGGIYFGPYVNRNHYAGLMEMIFPLAMSLFLYYRPKGKHPSFRKRLIGILSHPQANIAMLLGFSAVLIATSVFLSLSRGGIAGLAMSCLFLGYLLWTRPGQGRRGLLFAATIIVILYAVGWFGWKPVFERFQNIRNAQGEISELRLDLWKDSLNIIRDFPLTGTGFGSYINIYPSYRTIASDRIVDHAHNDYIELFTNGGAVAVLLLLWFTVVVLTRSYRAFQRRKDPFSISLYSGIITGIFSILLHSVTDFNLQIGANGLFMFVLLGMAVSASHTKIHEGNHGTLLRSVNSFPGKCTMAVSFAVLVLCIFFYGGRLTGTFLHSEIRHIPLGSKATGENLRSVSDTLGRASFFDPLEPQYHFIRAVARSLSSDAPGALMEYKAAVSLDPANSVYLQSLGLFLSKKGEEKYADVLLRSGTIRDRSNPDAHRLYAAWLAKQGRKDESIEVFKKALSLEPIKTREYIAAMVLSGLTDEEIRSALPELTASYIIFANYLEKTGNDKMASDIYMTALSYAGSSKEPSAGYFYTVYNFYVNKQLFSNAAYVMEKAAGLFPRDPAVRQRLAEAYEKEDLKDKALEQYRLILDIDPKNNIAVKKIQELR